jgi:quinol monooxygenase YgiN
MLADVMRREAMIYVVVSIRVKAGKLPEFLGLFGSVVPLVREEKGCVQYVAATDFDSGLPPQVFDKDVVTILEKWEGIEALRNHLAAPHMASFFEKEKALTEGSSIKILTEA